MSPPLEADSALEETVPQCMSLAPAVIVPEKIQGENASVAEKDGSASPDTHAEDLLELSRDTEKTSECGNDSSSGTSRSNIIDSSACTAENGTCSTMQDNDEMPPSAGEVSAANIAGNAAEREGDDTQEEPTDEQLMEAIQDVLGSVEDMGQLTPKQVVIILQERFSCSLQHRKKSIKNKLVDAMQAQFKSQDVSPSDEEACPSVNSGNEDEREDGNMSSGSASLTAGGGGEHEAQQEGDDADSPLSSYASSSSSSPSAARDALGHSAQTSFTAGAAPADESDSSLASSPEDDDDEDENEDNSGRVLPRPEPRKTSARRALAKAKFKRTVRGVRAKADGGDGGARRKRHIVGASDKSASSDSSEGRSSAEGSVVSSNAESSASGDKASGAVRSTSGRKPARRKPKMLGSKKTIRSAVAANSDSDASGVAASRVVSSCSSSDGAGSDGYASDGLGGMVKRKGRASRNTKRKKKTVTKRKTKIVQSKEDDGGSALVNSDEEADESGIARTGTRNASGSLEVVKAVVDEELEAVNEKKLKERERIAAERQRQLAALRVMDAAQLKEATRAQQGTLLAKIKERQGRIHAALAASAKEELKLLRVEARKAAGILDDDDEEKGEDGEDDESKEAVGDREVAAENDGDDGEGGRSEGAMMQVEDMVEAEEKAIAAATAAAAAAGVDAKGEGSDAEGLQDAEVQEEEDKEEEEEEDRDFDMSVTLSVGPKQESESDVSSSSDSGSDSELEILPEDPNAALKALMGKAGAAKAVAVSTDGTPVAPARKDIGATSKGEGAAARALAALPKGMRFSSPKVADKSRVANRRRLAASARTVANDRWAAQLGYQDGQEHIRDLKYMELKRRQQAHHDRERKLKESDALHARLCEYAAHADEDEEEFGAGEAGHSATDSTATTAADTSDAPKTAVVDESAPEGGSANAQVPAGEAILTGPSPATEGAKVGEQEDEIRDAMIGANSDNARSDRVEAGPESPAGAVSNTRAADITVSAEKGTNDSSMRLPPDAAITAGTAASIAASTVKDIVEEAIAEAVGVPSATVSPLTPAAATSRPKVVRTYGRKVKDAERRSRPSGTGDSQSDPLAAEGGSRSRDEDTSMGDTGNAGVVSPESQALWQEESDSESPMAGCGEESLALSWGLDDDFVDEGATQQPSMEHPAADATDDINADADSDGSTLEERDTAVSAPSAEKDDASPAQGAAGVKRKLEQTTEADGLEGGTGDSAASAPTSAAAATTAAAVSTETVIAVAVAGSDQTTTTGKAAAAAVCTLASSSTTTSSTTTTTTSSYVKMKVSADGALEAAAVQPRLSNFFGKPGPVVSDNSTADLHASSAATKTRETFPPAKKKTGIAAFLCATTATTTAGDGAASSLDATAAMTSVSISTSVADSGGSEKGGGAATTEVTALESGDGGSKTEEGGRGREAVVAEQEDVRKEGDEEKGIEKEEDQEDQEDQEEPEEPKEPKDRSAKFRAMLEAEREANRHAKKLRKSGMMDDEAEEEEEEEAVRGLGDFGFGVSAGGTGTAAAGSGGTGKKGDEEDEDDEIREEDLEGIVDTFSDDEGDKDAQDKFLTTEAAAGDRQALKDMVRRVREGFGDERGGRGRSGNARGNLRMEELTAADRSSRKEARRLGLLNSDEEWSDDEKGDGKENDDLEELDEMQLGELLAREQRARHMGLSQTAQDYLGSSDSEGEADGNGDLDGDGAEGKAEEDADRREEARVQKLWVKRAKRRRVLAEVEQGGDSQGPGLLMEQDEDSQAIMSLLQCTNSRLGFSGSMGGGVTVESHSTGGQGTGNAGDTAPGVGNKGSKRRDRDVYSGELNAEEVANGFGMGMSSKPLKRAKSDGSEPKDVNAADARSRLERAFTMPQFVTSVAGYGGSARAKQVQRKGSFLSRSGSFSARSGSLASGKTTVSASKFVFTSSVPVAAADEDSCARTGFEESASRDSSTGGKRSGSSGRGYSTSRPPFSSSDGNVSHSSKNRKSSGDKGAFSGIGVGGVKGKGIGGGGGGPETGRLWKGLCASGKQKSRR